MDFIGYLQWLSDSLSCGSCLCCGRKNKHINGKVVRLNPHEEIIFKFEENPIRVINGSNNTKNQP